jgi:hypothetical protein
VRPCCWRVSFTSSIDFLPKFGIAASSFSLFTTRSPIVSMPTRLRQLYDRTPSSSSSIGKFSIPCASETSGCEPPSAAEILIRQLAIFTDIDKIEGFGEAAQAEQVAAEAPLAHGMENFPIEELELGVRSYNCLKRVGIETIGDLVVKSENELAAIPNFGKKSIEEVKETLATHGLNLRGDE